MKFSIALLLIVLLQLPFGCKSRQHCALVGSWVVGSVRSDFDEQKVNAQTFDQVMAYHKETKLVFGPDSTLVVIRGRVHIQTKWQLDSSTGLIKFGGEGVSFRAMSLRDGRLYASEYTPLGEIHLVFVRSEP